jgi:hypothetical protein
LKVAVEKLVSANQVHSVSYDVDDIDVLHLLSEARGDVEPPVYCYASVSANK